MQARPDWRGPGARGARQPVNKGMQARGYAGKARAGKGITRKSPAQRKTA
ncbi:hypothetical protein GCM10027278_10350 [Paralcaligenes ginsengisoli]